MSVNSPRLSVYLPRATDNFRVCRRSLSPWKEVDAQNRETRIRRRADEDGPTPKPKNNMQLRKRVSRKWRKIFDD